MAREKGTGSLQREKSGRYTLRVGINGKRYSRSTRTTDKAKAEQMLDRFLAPFGLGSRKLPLAEAWHHYEMSPQRKDIARSTMNAKRVAWMRFARWVEENHIEVTHLGDVTDIVIAEYLAEYRCHHTASTYNGHVCTLREVFKILSDKAGLVYDPWGGVRLLSDDSLSRRELTIGEIEQLYIQAEKQGAEWKLLIMTGLYTGLRLGDCCHLKWENVNLERGIIQVVPEKTKKHAHGRPVTIPIHPQLLAELLKARGMREEGKEENNSTLQLETQTSSSSSPIPHPPSPWNAYVNPKVAEYHIMTRWRVDEGLRKIFNAAGITMSVHVEGRKRKHVLASFHSLRHTFVSISANAGVPLPVVQSIVGHCSSAMTRHYYHENLDALRSAVASIPVIGKREKGKGKSGDEGWGMRDEIRGEWGMVDGERTSSHPSSSISAPCASSNSAPCSIGNISRRLKRIDRMFSKGLITEAEFATHRARILSEM